MSQKKMAFLVFLVLPLLLGMAFAEEEEAHSSSLMAYLGKVFNFIALFGALFFFLRKPLSEMLGGRAQGIASAIREAKNDRKEMEEEARLSAGRLERLEDEILKILGDARQEGNQIKDRIQQSAEKEAEKIREWNRQEIDMFYQAKVKELKTQAAEWATALARKNITEKMTPEKHSFILERSIDSLEDIHER